MLRNFERSLTGVLKSEGGFVDDPHDPGGATNMGVTLATFRRFVNPRATVDDLKRVTSAQVATVYRKQYWNAVKGDDLPDGVDYSVFDFAVNSGPGRAAKFLQTIVGAQPDGKIGAETLSAARAMDPSTVIERLADRRLEFLEGLPTWGRYKNGWTDRVHSVREASLAMATKAPPKPVQPQQPAPAPQPPPMPERAPTAPAGGAGIGAGVALVLAFTAAFWTWALDGWQHIVSFIEGLF